MAMCSSACVMGPSIVCRPQVLTASLMFAIYERLARLTLRMLGLKQPPTGRG